MPGKRWSAAAAGEEEEGAKSFYCFPPPAITIKLVDRPTQLICIWISIDILASHLRLLSYPSKLRSRLVALWNCGIDSPEKAS